MVASYLFILSYRTHLSYLITALVLSFSFIYGCGLVSQPVPLAAVVLEFFSS